MAEISGFWTTTGTATGDQQASYTQIHWSTALKILAACNGFEGVASDYLNDLACTVTGANTVAMNTGGGLVDGKWYYNDASQNINIPSASGGGNTRIDRLVLRADWANFNVSLYRIAGTDAVTPSAPAVTQTSGTTYDIMLYQALVDTDGAVILTDERVYADLGDNSIDSQMYVDGSIDTAHIANAQITLEKMAANSVDSNQYVDGSIDTEHIANAQITLAKMAAESIDSDQYVDGSIDTAHLANDSVDDTKVGNRVPQLYRRQGGGVYWYTAGTTDYTPTTVRMQTGSMSTATGYSVTFPVAFSEKPTVFLSRGELGIGQEKDVTFGITGISTTGFTYWTWDISASTVGTAVILWLAIGPE